MTASNYLVELAQFVAGTRFKDLSDATIDAARDVTLDTLGAIAAGALEPENARLAAWASEQSLRGESGIIGSPHRANPMMAALVNATAGVALEMDEGNRFGGGHPAIHVLPGLLAVAEDVGATGAEFIAALVVGYEVTSRLGGATVPRPNVHSHGHWGAPGTAAAIARLRNWATDDTARIINVAASMSPANSWMNAYGGATVRNLYPGRSSMQGVIAVELHQCGFSALEDAPSDVYGTLLGESFDPEAVTAGLGTEFRIEQNYFKLHACCRYNHATLDAVNAASDDSEFDPADVESVVVQVPWMAGGMLGDYPANMLAAKFNLRYAVSAALVKGTTDVTVFRPDVIADHQVRRVFDRVNVVVGDVPQGDAIRSPAARAKIRLSNGRVSEGRTSLIRGDYGNRIPRTEIVDKFLYLAEPAIGSPAALKSVDLISRLELVEDVNSVTRLFETASE